MVEDCAYPELTKTGNMNATENKVIDLVISFFERFTSALSVYYFDTFYLKFVLC